MLTAKQIAKLPDGTYCDAGGLYIRVQGASRHWVLRVQVDGRRREAGLGSYPAVTLAAARLKAAALRSRAKSGEDIFAKKAKSRLFGDVLREALDTRRRSLGLRESTVEGREIRARLYILPALGSMPVDAVGRAEVVAVLRPIVARSLMLADRVRWLLEYVIRYATSAGLRSGENPATKAALSALFPGKVSAAGHFESPGFAELRDALPRALADAGPSTSGLAAAFIALTALRVGETLSAKWSDLSDDGMTLVIPWQTAKTGRLSKEDFRVPLSEQAREILKRTRGRSDYLFPGRDGRMTGKAVCAALKRATGSGTVTIHGVRSTFRDWAARTGVDHVVAEKCLSHVVGSAVVAAYLRDDLLDRRREVMQQWADALMPRPRRG